MAYKRRVVMPTLLLALALPLLPLQTLPLQAQEQNDLTSTQVGGSEKAKDGREGLASYYAKRFQGRKTTSGARYHPDKLTAASPDIPLGARVRVTNLANGREVVVTVNDRCRMRSRPFIDLSRAAAKRLGFLGRGTAKVLITLLRGGDGPGAGSESVID